MSYSRRSWRELWTGLTSAHIWLKLAWVDIVSRYRRTLLGPFWLVLSHAATIVGLSLLYSHILHQDTRTYLLYITCGLTIWTLIVIPFADGPNILVRSQNLILAYDLPISLHIMRAVCGYLITFLHNMVVFICVLPFTDAHFNANSLLFLPALAVIMVAVTGVSMIVSVLGARYRDLGPALIVVTSIAFLLTPIFWNKAQALGINWITAINPFFHFVEIARAAMLGQPPNLTSWAAAIAIAAFTFVAGAVTVVGSRSNIAYWV